ncbi:Desumoylating isopeptidase 1 [Trichoderma lentiforme]|uniref:Desumoylating isopeptidase 1 n=1 Tax=Trichoderma lentiforme TaxID=1567552 RepID=A0A9P5CGS6_9HYPO|nr:Desumoylating isopeptidase 1 [Trichoderma lentiforme]
MDVHLLVYDLSQGLARQMSMGLLGFQLDAIYHTSIELQGREYVYDGGIISIVPGSSHLGQPLERLHLGKTNLPMDVIGDYLESIRSIFTIEAYDLFRHNCNNFTDAFSNFLLGKGIPSHIAQMPQAVLDSPFGRMLMPQLTQGVNASRQNGSILGLQQSSQPIAPVKAASSVKNVTSQSELSALLDQAKTSCAVVYFTSATCAPCKMLYPLYDQLAEEFAGKATLIKIDIAQPQASLVASQYSISATPTFVTFLKGEQENRWSGADQAALRGNVQLLVQMAHPSHPHEKLRLPTFANPNSKPVLFAKVPPMQKLMAKMGAEISSRPEVEHLRRFIEDRTKGEALDAVLPNMGHMASFLQESVTKMPIDTLFTIVDLFRCALLDPRVSGYFAEETSHRTVVSILNTVNEQSECPYALRLVTLQMACNFFSTPLFPDEILRNEHLRAPITRLISTSFLDDGHSNTRVAASSLLFNIALTDRKSRLGEAKPSLPDEDLIELAASVVEAIAQEETSAEALQGMLSALGHLVYFTNLQGELADLLRALDAEGTVLAKKKAFPKEALVTEVGSELLGKGLRAP